MLRYKSQGQKWELIKNRDHFKENNELIPLFCASEERFCGIINKTYREMKSAFGLYNFVALLFLAFHAEGSKFYVFNGLQCFIFSAYLDSSLFYAWTTGIRTSRTKLRGWSGFGNLSTGLQPEEFILFFANLTRLIVNLTTILNRPIFASFFQQGSV